MKSQLDKKDEKTDLYGWRLECEGRTVSERTREVELINNIRTPAALSAAATSDDVIVLTSLTRTTKNADIARTKDLL